MMKSNPMRTALSLAIATLLAVPVIAAAEAAAPVSAATGPSAEAGTATEATAVTGPAAATDLDAVQVRGEYIPEPMQHTPQVASFVTREDLERTGDGDAAAALSRVSGLSVVGDKFVYVRGLGERYSSALLNGSPLPSPEPMQRVVPLDLLPSQVLQGITVQKTYSARYPGEFGGGVIDLSSLSVPDAPFLKLSAGIGGNSVTTGENGLVYFGSDRDQWGRDDGARKMSPELDAALGTGLRINDLNFSAEDLRTIGRSFNDPNLYLLQQSDSIDPDFSFGGSGGYLWELGNGARLGAILVGGFKNEWRSRFGVQQEGDFVAGEVDLREDFDFHSTRNNTRTNGMLAVGLEGERNQVSWTTLYVRDTQKEARSQAGFAFVAGGKVRDDHTSWIQRSMVNNQLAGKHVFGEFDDVTVEWRGAMASARRWSPYESNVRYQWQDGYWAHLAGGVAQNEFTFSNVDDDVSSAGADLTWNLPTERSYLLKAGVAWSDNDRGFQERRFRYVAGDGSLPFYNQFQRIDYLLSDYNISQGIINFTEITGTGMGAAAYDASLETRAVYAEIEGEVVDLVRVGLGLRWEDASQEVVPYDIFTGAHDSGQVAPLENSYLLPSATVTWNFADNQQFRFGASKTIARPQFREMAPQWYTDPENNSRNFLGNPNLVDSELFNLDARYEWFFGAGEYFTAGLFYKTIDRPIESMINTNGSVIFQSFLNAPEARVYGLEVDFKKYYDAPSSMSWLAGNRFYVASNFTLSDSEVRVRSGDTVHPYGFPAPVDASLFIRDGARLQGQSDQIGNLQLGLESADASSQATLIVNYVSERISARGLPGQPDYMQRPGTTVDFNLRKGLSWSGYRGEIGFAARNLLDTDFREFQTRDGNRIDLYRYSPGISYEVNVSFSF